MINDQKVSNLFQPDKIFLKMVIKNLFVIKIHGICSQVLTDKALMQNQEFHHQLTKNERPMPCLDAIRVT